MSPTPTGGVGKLRPPAPQLCSLLLFLKGHQGRKLRVEEGLGWAFPCSQ